MSTSSRLEGLFFSKMHGLGNDFIVVHQLKNMASSNPPITQSLTPLLAKNLCDRRRGVGADQVLLLKSPNDSSCDARMEILNSDGSVAEMCGNGIRAAGLYLQKYLSSFKTEYRIETLAGIKSVSLKDDLITVDMGSPQLGFEIKRGVLGESLLIQSQTHFQSLSEQRLHFYEVNMGNPHAVIFVEDVTQVELEKIGSQIEHHPRFPRQTNVEFVEVCPNQLIKVRVWERGAGATQACGTGACAAAIATIATQRAAGPLTVELPGGRLTIDWKMRELGQSAPCWMSGPAVEVFRGVYFT